MGNTTYGFIGLGHMGSPMARRVLEDKRPLMVHDVSPDAAARIAQEGAVAAPSLRAVVEGADVIFLSLPEPSTVQAVAREIGAAATADSRARYVVDFSTIGPKAAVEVAAVLREHQIIYVEAPVSGGPKGAANGTLAVMVSCASQAFEEVGKSLEIFGTVFHVGEGYGQAQTLKLANNMLSVCAVVATAEALSMGVKAGLSPTRMLEVINKSSGRNTATEAKYPRAVVTRTFDYGFSTRLAYKDVRLCVDESEGLGVPMIIGAAVRQIMAITNSSYGPDSDFTTAARVVEQWSGVEIKG